MGQQSDGDAPDPLTPLEGRHSIASMTHGRLSGLMMAAWIAGAIPAQTQSAVTVTGTLTIMEKGGKRATDVADAVVWLEGGHATAKPVRVEINTHDKKF